MDWLKKVSLTICVSALGGGITLFFELNYKVARMLEIATSDENILAITLIIVGLVGIISYLIQYHWSFLGSLRFQGPSVFAKKHDSLPDRQEQQSGIEFFPTIDALRTKHPLPETFKIGNEIHAYLLTGEGIFAENGDYMEYVKRLILPRPDGPEMLILKKLSNPYVDFRVQILKTIELAKSKNTAVKLFPSFIGVSLLFCNPQSEEGWVQIGIIIPGSVSAERQHWRIYRVGNRETFFSFWNTFDRLWNEGTTDSIEDLEFHSGYYK